MAPTSSTTPSGPFTRSSSDEPRQAKKRALRQLGHSRKRLNLRASRQGSPLKEPKEHYFPSPGADLRRGFSSGNHGAAGRFGHRCRDDPATADPLFHAGFFANVAPSLGGIVQWGRVVVAARLLFVWSDWRQSS